VAAAETTPGPAIVSIGDELVHVARFVTTCGGPADIVAVATSEIFSPAGTDVSPAGEVVIAIDNGIATVTVTVVTAVIPIHAACIVAVPAATAVTTPVADTVAAVPLFTVQVAYPVMFTNVPLSNVPVTVSCCFSPAASVSDGGDTLSPVRCPEFTVSCVDATTGELAPLGVQLAVIVVVPAVSTVKVPGLTVAVAPTTGVGASSTRNG